MNIEIIVAIVGGAFITINFFVQFFTQRHFAKKDLKQSDISEQIEEVKTQIGLLQNDINSISDTTKVLLYDRLAQKIEYILTKGCATSEERHELQMMYEEYKNRGFNGDMDSRMEKVYASRTVHAPYDK